MTVGESFHPSAEDAREYVRESNGELDAIFSFGHLDSDNIGGKKFFPKPFDLRQFKKGLFDPQRAAYGEGWNTLVLENHDNPRSVDRFSIDASKYRYEAATMLATVMYMGFGTPFIYMGQESGLTNCDFSDIDEMKDPVSHFVYDLMTGYGIPRGIAFRFIKYGARDHSRVPIAWDDSVNGGFNSGHEPWQCVNPLYSEINVKKDLLSDKSVYRFYQKLLRLRKRRREAVLGETREYDHKNRRIIAYSRTYQGRRLFVCANFSKHVTIYRLPDDVGDYKIILNNYEALGRSGQKVRLRPYQAVVLRVI